MQTLRVKAILDRLAERRHRRATTIALSALSDRQLDDLGICRNDLIPQKRY